MEQCEYTIKVSELMDGELSFEESERVTLHLESCPVCWDAHQSFLRSRDQLRSYESVTDDRVRQRLLSAPQREFAFWGRSLRVPFPAVAATIVVLVALIVWSSLEGARRVTTGGQSVTRVTPVAAGDIGKDASGGTDLARFDRGDRLVIYKEPRVHTGDTLR